MNDKAPEQTESAPRQITVNAQYIKDLSFENPAAPASLMPQETPPQIELTVDIQAQKLQDDVYEVALHITAKATVEKGTLFLADLTYAGIFTTGELPDNQKELILLVYCPTLIFPFARRIIADITRDGGFPPLMIDPVDFAALYHKRALEQARENETVN